jgi:hypothetical protein
MASPRKRSLSKKRRGTAGKRKTALRKGAPTVPRTRHHGPVAEPVGPESPKHSLRKPTKRASSRRRAAEKGESLAPKPPRDRSDITDADIVKIPGLARVRARDLGLDSE